jgi:hypothetical protein
MIILVKLKFKKKVLKSKRKNRNKKIAIVKRTELKRLLPSIALHTKDPVLYIARTVFISLSAYKLRILHRNRI